MVIPLTISGARGGGTDWPLGGPSLRGLPCSWPLGIYPVSFTTFCCLFVFDIISESVAKFADKSDNLPV